MVLVDHQAILNMSLREEIVNSEEVASFYRKYTLEDGNIVRLDSSLASEHVRQCIDLKRPRATQPLFKVSIKVLLSTSIIIIMYVGVESITSTISVSSGESTPKRSTRSSKPKVASRWRFV